MKKSASNKLIFYRSSRSNIASKFYIDEVFLYNKVVGFLRLIVVKNNCDTCTEKLFLPLDQVGRCQRLHYCGFLMLSDI